MKRIQRFFSLVRVFFRYRLDTFIPNDRLGWPLRILLGLATLPLPTPKDSSARRLRMALESLGPVFVKFGQALSTRRDILDDELAAELALLQDKVAPFPSDASIALIEKALNQPVSELFSEFESTPLASASVAQVHAAKLKTGEDVVVKVIRPGIEHIIEQDVALLLLAAKGLTRYHPDGPRLNAVQVVEDYRLTVLDELDLQREAANTSQLRRNFLDSGLLYVPEVYWDYSRRNVFVMERIDGIPVNDLEAIEAQGTNLKLLAERGVEIFFTQVFRDSFFHADMHPGNVFVSREHPEDPSYIGIDCAIIGSLSEFDQYYLARNLLAIFQRDYKMVAELHIECGWVPADTKVNDFEAAIRSVCEPIFEKPLGEISFAQVLLHLFQTARRFQMEVQPSLVLLQKTLLHIEGLGRQLYPELDLWNTAQPFLEDWIKARYSPQSLVKRLQKQAPGWLEQLPQIPELVFENLKHGQQNSQLAQAKIEKMEKAFRREKRQRSRQMWALGSFLVAAVVSNPSWAEPFQALPGVSWFFIISGAVLLTSRVRD